MEILIGASIKILFLIVSIIEKHVIIIIIFTYIILVKCHNNFIIKKKSCKKSKNVFSLLEIVCKMDFQKNRFI